jgi:hypothetical protein
MLCVLRLPKKLKIDTLALYAHKFGFGEKSNFLLPEQSGLVPSSGWKMATKGERWWKGETLSACIGQSYLLVTPLQVVRMVSAICSGTLVRPRILESEPVTQAPLQISARTLRLLRDSMADAVNFGTVRLLSYVRDFEIHAKTGTAQTCSLERQKTSRQMLEHGWVTGYFKYQDNKPLAFIVFVENAGSSHPALAIADKFLRAYKHFLRTGETTTLKQTNIEQTNGHVSEGAVDDNQAPVRALAQDIGDISGAQHAREDNHEPAESAQAKEKEQDTKVQDTKEDHQFVSHDSMLDSAPEKTSTQEPVFVKGELTERHTSAIEPKERQEQALIPDTHDTKPNEKQEEKFQDILPETQDTSVTTTER